MADYTLTEDTAIESLTLAAGKSINLNGHVLTVSTDVSQYELDIHESQSGTLRLLSGGHIDISYSTLAPGAGVVFEGGSPESPLPAHGDGSFPLRSAACLVLGGVLSYDNKIISHCVGNSNRVQFAKILSATSSTLTFDRDMELEVGDVIGCFLKLTQDADQEMPMQTVSDYDPETFTASLAGTLAKVPQSGSGCVLLTSGFCISPIANAHPCLGSKASIHGDEVAILEKRFRTYPFIFCNVNLGRFVLGGTGFYAMSAFAMNEIKAGVYVSNAANGPRQTPFETAPYPLCGKIGRAYCPSLIFSYYNWGNTAAGNSPYKGNQGRGLYIGGGYHSIYPWEPYGRMECVDCEQPATLYGSLRDTAELVVRTTSPETCAIHRAGGVATLVKRGGGDSVIEDAPVSEAFQLVPTGTDAVWHDEAYTVEAGKRLTVAWRAYCDAGATAGVQILADSPLFGQVAVPMGAAEVLAEYTESSPAFGVWNPSRLLSWRNTGDAPARVWVRGWGMDGTVYSSFQTVKGGPI